MKRLQLLICYLVAMLAPTASFAQSWDWIMGGTELPVGPDNFITPKGEVIIPKINPQKILSTAFADTIDVLAYQKFDQGAQYMCGTGMKGLQVPGDGFIRSAVEINDTVYAMIGFSNTVKWDNQTFDKYDYCLAKIDKNCNWLSCNKIGLRADIRLYTNGKGDLYFGCHSRSTVFTQTGVLIKNPVVGEMDKDGNILWVKEIKTKDDAGILDQLKPDNNGDLYCKVINIGALYQYIYRVQNGRLTDSIDLSYKLNLNLLTINENYGSIYISLFSKDTLNIGKKQIPNSGTGSNYIIELNKDLSYKRHWVLDGERVYIPALTIDDRDIIHMGINVNYPHADTVITFNGTDIFVPSGLISCILKLDSSGNVRWHEVLRSSDSTLAVLVVLNKDDCHNVYARGYLNYLSSGRKTYGELYLGDKTLKYTTNGSSCTFVAKLNPDTLSFKSDISCDRIKFTNTSPMAAYTSFEWILPGDSVVVADTLVLDHNPYDKRTSIGLKGYKPGGCSNILYKVIDLTGFQPAKALFAPDTVVVCQWSALQFSNHTLVNPSVMDKAKFIWFFGDGDSSSARQPSHIYKKPGQYSVQLIYDNGYCSDTFTYPQPIQVLEAEDLQNTICKPMIPLIHLPNAFSPNGDGLNDSFSMSGVGVESLHIEIYNRWGERVFSSDSPDFRWDGRYKSAAPIMGVYRYRIQAQGYNGELKYYNGTLQLLP